MAEATKGGFYMKIFRVGPSDTLQRGGVGIYIKSERLESLTKSAANGRVHQFLGNTFHLVARGAMTALNDYQNSFHCSTDFMEVLMDEENGRVFLWPLLMTGIAEGAVVMLPGVFPKDMLKAYAQSVRATIKRLWAQYLCPITLELTTTEEELDVAS